MATSGRSGGDPPREDPYLYRGPDAVRSVDSEDRHRPSPDLFARLSDVRWIIARLVVESVMIVAGVLLVAVAPLLGGLMIVVGVIALVVDLVLLRRARRTVAEAWVDLSLPPDGRE